MAKHVNTLRLQFAIFLLLLLLFSLLPALLAIFGDTSSYAQAAFQHLVRPAATSSPAAPGLSFFVRKITG